MKTIIYYIILVTLFLACKNEPVKESSLSATQKNRVAPNNKMINPAYITFDELQQGFSFNSKERIKITGNQGTKIEFPENCFGDYNGKVSVKLVEVYDIGTMIKLNLTTETINDELLESGGMIFIEPTDSLGTVLMPQKKYSIDYTRNKDSRMQLFKTSKNKLSEPSEWELLPNAKRPPIKRSEKVVFGRILGETDTVNVYDEVETIEEQFIFETLSIGWLNCDRFILDNNEHLITQNFNVKGGDEDLTYIIVFKNYNTLVSRQPNSEGKVKFESLPKDEPVFGLAMKLEEDSVKLEIKEFILSATNSIVFTNINKVGIDEFDSIAKELFTKDLWNR